MKNKKILISGAGIGSLTLAYFLKKEGFEPVIIEKSASLRDGGYMIDFFSSGIYVAEQMGIIDDLKRKDHHSCFVKQFTHKNKKSNTINLSNLRESLAGKFFNFLRTDLIDVLYEKVKNNVDIRYSTSIKRISETKSGVHIIFEDGKYENFDLLIGADGIHSNTRKLIYTESEVNQYYLGYYIAGFEHNVPLDIKKREFYSMISPKKQLMSYALSTNKYISLFVFKSKHYEQLKPENKLEIISHKFKNFNFPVPEIIDQAKSKNTLFFEEVSQIRIKGTWHKGRIALLGDAAYCITLLSGQGASMAMTGAYVLAEKLAKTEGEYIKAFESYESDLRPHVEKMQEKAVKNTASFLPSTTFNLWLRNLLIPLFFTKLFIPFLIKRLGAENYFERY
ncbi:MAG: FAD-dependent monooxygenase [Methylococcales bacterium]|nr:FAD-dependent monooxygenase [Methylococcales bacterium]